LLPEIHRLYFEPQYPEFSARTMSSLSNAFTSAFKKLDPVPQFKATAKLGAFLAPIAGITNLAPFRVAIILNRAGSSSTNGCVMGIRLAPSDKPGLTQFLDGRLSATR
jgi:hypothetical protein